MRKETIFLLEIFIWLILISSISFFGINLASNYFSNQKSYQVEFKDADGIIIGSPVRYMGIDIGHVNKLKINNDKVVITFVVNQREVDLSESSNVSINFTGLAGAKSIEILNNSGAKHVKGVKLNVLEPTRVDFIMEAQTAILESVVDNSKKVFKLFENKDSESLEKDFEVINEITTKTNSVFDAIIKYVENLSVKVDDEQKAKR